MQSHFRRSFVNLNLSFSAQLRKMGSKSETLIQDLGKIDFLNFGTVLSTAVKFGKLRKGHYSPSLVGQDNSMVFTFNAVNFPATRDLPSLMAGNGTWWEKKNHFVHTSDGRQILMNWPEWLICQNDPKLMTVLVFHEKLSSYVIGYWKKEKHWHSWRSTTD